MFTVNNSWCCLTLNNADPRYPQTMISSTNQILHLPLPRLQKLQSASFKKDGAAEKLLVEEYRG